MTTKQCSKCNKNKPLAEFHKDKSRKSGRTVACALCRNTRSRGRNKAQRAATRMHRRYGITMDEYDQQLSRQNGACAICKAPPLRRRLCVDHNHDTGRVRGLLCDPCNRAIGGLKDSAELCLTAANYLQESSQP